MAKLKLNRIYKVYPNGVKAVNDFSIDIGDKEFIVFVGPSGCGKSTTLRMIAGLEEITAGELYLDDKLVNDVEAEDRDIAMVFQNYALYPHMTVYENMAFGLRNRKVKEPEIKEKILEAVRILDLENYLQKKPKEMSGGQRQRVALGRAIVRNPKVFLFDEPLSNLDAKLRASMRSEITKLHKKLATTFIYVTHDQVEAMTMGTRIVVMKDGFVQQIDAPMNLYDKPINKFVAGFIGTPQMNFFEVTLTRDGDDVVMKFNEQGSYRIPYDVVCKVDDKYLHGTKKVWLGVRPEHFIITKEKTGLTLGINFLEKLGNETIIYGDIDQNAKDLIISENANSVIIKTVDDLAETSGDTINIKIKNDKIHLFDFDTEQTILKEIPDFSTVTSEVKGGKMSLLGTTIKLPPVYLDRIKDEKQVTLLVPPKAIIDGSDFTLKVKKVEQLEGQQLLHLSAGDKYLFVLDHKIVKEGEDYPFSLCYDALELITPKESILQAIPTKQTLMGKFVRVKSKVNNHDVLKMKNTYFMNIGQHAIELSKETAKKIVAIDGRHSFNKLYKLVFDLDAVEMDPTSNWFGQVIEKLDYTQSSYVKIDIEGQPLLLKVDSKEKVEEKVAINLDVNAFEIWHPEIDFRIV